MSAIAGPQDRREAYMQGWSLVEGAIETEESSKQITRPTGSRWRLETAAQWERKEARNGENLHREQAFPMDIEFLARPADEERQRIENVGAPIREDGPGKEWSVLFPRKHQAGNMRAMACNIIGESVREKEKRAQKPEPR